MNAQPNSTSPDAAGQSSQPPEQPWTIGRLIQWTTDFLKKSGSDTARLDAEILLAHARGCQRIQLYTAYEEAASEELRETFRGLVRRRSTGEPVAYLVGEREFFSLPFLVNKNVLIPRPETEGLVVLALDKIKELVSRELASGGSDSFSPAVCDVGTGSGAIAVSIAKHSAAQVTAVDISAAALEVATENAKRNGLEEKIDFRESDLLAGLDAEQVFDLIVSNPPYVTVAEYAELPPDVKNYEPLQALVGGEQGTEIISRLTQQSARHLKPGGWLMMEVSPMIAAKVKEIFANAGDWQDVEIVPDLSRQDRLVVGRRR